MVFIGALKTNLLIESKQKREETNARFVYAIYLFGELISRKWEKCQWLVPTLIRSTKGIDGIVKFEEKKTHKISLYYVCHRVAFQCPSNSRHMCRWESRKKTHEINKERRVFQFLFISIWVQFNINILLMHMDTMALLTEKRRCFESNYICVSICI